MFAPELNAELGKACALSAARNLKCTFDEGGV
jgi:hypothetical protein